MWGSMQYDLVPPVGFEPTYALFLRQFPGQFGSEGRNGGEQGINGFYELRCGSAN